MRSGTGLRRPYPPCPGRIRPAQARILLAPAMLREVVGGVPACAPLSDPDAGVRSFRLAAPRLVDFPGSAPMALLCCAPLRWNVHAPQPLGSSLLPLALASAACRPGARRTHRRTAAVPHSGRRARDPLRHGHGAEDPDQPRGPHHRRPFRGRPGRRAQQAARSGVRPRRRSRPGGHAHGADDAGARRSQRPARHRVHRPARHRRLASARMQGGRRRRSQRRSSNRSRSSG